MRRVFRDGIGPSMVAGFAEPVVGGLDGFEDWIRGTALRAGGDFVLRSLSLLFQLIEDVLWDWQCGDGLGSIKLIGGDVDLYVADSCLKPGNDEAGIRTLNPGLDACAPQHLASSCGVEGLAAAESDFPRVVARSAVIG